MSTLAGLVEGRIVHYVIDGTEDEHNAHLRGSRGFHCAAIVTRSAEQYGTGVANLLILSDDGETAFCDITHLVSRPYSEGKEPGTWHWIEREAP